MNDARSPYLVAACSDKSLRVWDLSATSGSGGGGGGGGGGSGAPPEVLRIPAAHSRAVHTLALPLASAHAQCPPASLDCVLTASAQVGGLVRLWDVRSAKCARQLAGGHVSRSLATGAALSPCATFVACGSEEKRAVVYDLRTSGVVERHAGASEAVTCVAWHPRRAALLAGSVDGGVRLYTE
jgi:WD40 repeat protein